MSVFLGISVMVTIVYTAEHLSIPLIRLVKISEFGLPNCMGDVLRNGDADKFKMCKPWVVIAKTSPVSLRYGLRVFHHVAGWQEFRNVDGTYWTSMMIMRL